jgi:hypothetical protein
MRAIVLGVLLVCATAAAKAPEGQGRACDSKRACDAGLRCVQKTGGSATCEIVCDAKTKCPEDQRCVKDGAQTVCKAITDL